MDHPQCRLRLHCLLFRFWNGYSEDVFALRTTTPRFFVWSWHSPLGWYPVRWLRSITNRICTEMHRCWKPRRRCRQRRRTMTHKETNTLPSWFTTIRRAFLENCNTQHLLWKMILNFPSNQFPGTVSLLEQFHSDSAVIVATMETGSEK